MIEEEIRSIAPGVAVEQLQTMDAVLAHALAPVRAVLVLVLAFGFVALCLAAIGLYGVLAYLVRQRTREIGIRVALGQSPARVAYLILAQGMRVVAAAVLVGVGGAAVAARLAGSMFYGVDPVDPPTYLAVTVVLSGAALLACWIPGRRATSVDPVEALRAD
jgi:ABC-type antimicrobial peptide transport system permease subunit